VSVATHAGTLLRPSIARPPNSRGATMSEQDNIKTVQQIYADFGQGKITAT